MSRVIKFRVWQNALKHMDIFTIDTEFDCISGWLDNCELMQYTGLKDKNGVEIYEGDKLKLNTRLVSPMIVKWDKDRSSFMAHAHNRVKQKNFRKTLTSTLARKVEVIGNIYQNPERFKP